MSLEQANAGLRDVEGWRRNVHIGSRQPNFLQKLYEWVDHLIVKFGITYPLWGVADIDVDFCFWMGSI